MLPAAHRLTSILGPLQNKHSEAGPVSGGQVNLTDPEFAAVSDARSGHAQDTYGVG